MTSSASSSWRVVVALAGGGQLEIGPIVKLCIAAALFVVVGPALSAHRRTGLRTGVLDQLKAPGEVIVGLLPVLWSVLLRRHGDRPGGRPGRLRRCLILSGSKRTHAISDRRGSAGVAIRDDFLRADRHQHGSFR